MACIGDQDSGTETADEERMSICRSFSERVAVFSGAAFVPNLQSCRHCHSRRDGREKGAGSVMPSSELHCTGTVVSSIDVEEHNSKDEQCASTDFEQNSSEDELNDFVGGGSVEEGRQLISGPNVCAASLCSASVDDDASDEEVCRLLSESAQASSLARDGRHAHSTVNGCCHVHHSTTANSERPNAEVRCRNPACCPDIPDLNSAKKVLRSLSASPPKRRWADLADMKSVAMVADYLQERRPRLNLEKMHQKAAGCKRHYPRITGVKSCSSSPKAKLSCLITPLDFRSISSIQRTLSPLSPPIERPVACSF